MRDHGRWIFLVVVGRQPVVIRTDKRFEEAPRASREQARELYVFRWQEFSFSGAWPAHPVSNERRQQPEHREWSHYRQTDRFDFECKTERDQRQQQRR